MVELKRLPAEQGLARKISLKERSDDGMIVRRDGHETVNEITAFESLEVGVRIRLSSKDRACSMR